MPAEDSSSNIDWDRIARKPEFHALLETKARFVIRASIFFVLYYFALPILVGWWPELMKKEVLGKVNIAYLFALSQFFMAWILAFIYIGKAAQWDKIAEALKK